ncbi:Neuroendocrine convertase 1 [Mactra antiquata]
METEYNITDSWWDKQWHLHPDHVPSMEVYEAWMEGYTGHGIVLAFVDDGVDPTHPELIDNYDGSLSYNYVSGVDHGSHLNENDQHGTLCSGIAMAVKNTECVIGVSHQAKFTSLRLLDDTLEPTNGEIASTLTHRLDVIDIYSNSWGFPGHGSGFFPRSRILTAGFEKGVNEGRQGRGAIYVFASGNDGLHYDDCNTDSFISSVYTIGVNSLGFNGSLAGYGESCTSVLISAYGGTYDNHDKSKIATTSRHGDCVDNFLGTSATCPIVSGIIALTLEANSNLTWRDVQHLIVETASTEGLSSDLNFIINGAGKIVSDKVGFGLINASGMIHTAKTWKNVPTSITCVKDVPNIYRCCLGPFIETIQVSDCNIRYIEHIEVRVNYKAMWREFVELHLISPSGTDSMLLRQRYLDMTSTEVDHTFMTVHHWGEDTMGNWTFKMDEFYKCHNEIKLYSYTIKWYGTVTNVYDGQPPDGKLGGYCDENIVCTDGTLCRRQQNICIYCNLVGERIVNNICMKEGDIGGYCDIYINCTSENSVCNYDNNTCLLCQDNFRNIDGVCIEDGKIGGYCDGLRVGCIDRSIGCYENRCIHCTDGFHLYSSMCIKDGTMNGYCNEDILCSGVTGIGCLIESQICVNCNYWTSYKNIEGLCFQDGAIDGYCDVLTPCIDIGYACDPSTSRCDICPSDNYHVLSGYCWQDAVMFGYCNTSMTCEDDSVCSLHLNECVDCTEPGYRILQEFCVRDGTVGGYCNKSIKCTQRDTGCSMDTNLCVHCIENYVIQDGFCVLKSEEEAATLTYTILYSIVGTTAFLSSILATAIIVYLVRKKVQRLKPDMKKKGFTHKLNNEVMSCDQTTINVGTQVYRIHEIKITDVN